MTITVTYDHGGTEDIRVPAFAISPGLDGSMTVEPVDLPENWPELSYRLTPPMGTWDLPGA